MIYKRSQPRCDGCGICLSRTYPYNLCPACWQKKYHAPPGKNYFPADMAAKNRAECPIHEAPNTLLPHSALASSQVILHTVR